MKNKNIVEAFRTLAQSSPGTIQTAQKTHTNAYGKLGTTAREAAASSARLHNLA